MEKFITYSSEAEGIADNMLSRVYVRVFKWFNAENIGKAYCDDLDTIFICFVCTSKHLQELGFYPERKYVSHKKKYADMRPLIDYEQFIQAGETKQARMVWEATQHSIRIVQKRVPSLKGDELLADIFASFQHFYPEITQECQGECQG